MAMMSADFVAIPGGAFVMGAADGPHPEDGEGPARPVEIAPYAIAACAVSNAQFARFVRATGYVTTAEARGASHVFFAHLARPDTHPAPLPEAPWWRDVTGAQWRYPDGSTPAEPDHPVTHVSCADALAYCTWSGTRLPTEAEWECAAAGSAADQVNIWRGDFPANPVAPPGLWAVGSGVPNGNGLHHACGNVWEWTSDGFGRLHSPRLARNPTGNLAARSRVVKGGSYLCSPSYCARFRPSSRRPELPEATTGHLGFRVVQGSAQRQPR